MTHWEAGGEGAGKAFWSETQTDLKGGCVGLRSRGVCQRGQRFRQRGRFKKVREGRCSMGSWGPHRAVQPPELCVPFHTPDLVRVVLESSAHPSANQVLRG